MSEYICVFDSETTGKLDSFCYNVGYVIMDIDSHKIVYRADRVVEQIWHNLPLFQSAYYAEKRPIYVKAMRARQCKMDKFGYICAEMRRVFKQYDVHCAYAYNSSFDENIFNYNCNWYKCINPFDEVQIIDIRPLVINHMVNADYKKFCDDNALYTEHSNYSTTAETVYRYITKDTTFQEAHTALADAEIEAEILINAIANGATYGTTEIAPNSIERRVLSHWTVKHSSTKLYEFDANRVICSPKRHTIQIY